MADGQRYIDGGAANGVATAYLGCYATGRHVRDQALGNQLLDVRPSQEVRRALVHADRAGVLGLDVAAVDVAPHFHI